MTWPADLLALPSGVARLHSDVPGWVVLLLVGIVLIVPFGPVEAAAVTAGTLASAGAVPLWVAVLVVAASMLLGDLLLYAGPGSRLERARRRRATRPRPGVRRRLGVLRTALEARPWRRDAALAGLRLIPGARTPTTLVARSLGMSSTHFVLVAGAGSLLWAWLWTGGGSVVAGGVLGRLAG